MTDYSDIKKEYGDLTPNPSVRAFEAYTKIVMRGRHNAEKIVKANGGVANYEGITDDDRDFIREACKYLTPAEMLATTMGLTAYKNHMQQMANESSPESTDTRH